MLLFTSFCCYLLQGPIAAVVKTISGSNDDGAITNDQTINMPGVDCVAPAATEPLSMDVLVNPSHN